MPMNNTTRELIKAATAEATHKARIDVFTEIINQHAKDVRLGMMPELPPLLRGEWDVQRQKAIAEHARAKKATHAANTALEVEDIAKAAGASNPSLVAQVISERLRVDIDRNGEYSSMIVDASGNPKYNIRTGKAFSIAEYIGHMKTEPEYAMLFGEVKKEEDHGGSQTRNPFRKGPHYNLTQQSMMMQSNPSLAEKMKSEAQA